MLNDSLKIQCEAILGEKIRDTHPVSGGCISPAFKIELTSTKEVFLKTSPKNPDVFILEKLGLLELKKSGVIRVPEVYYADDKILLLEFMPSGKPNKSTWKNFGQNLASLHQVNSSEFGFYKDNYLGSTAQKNTPMVSINDITWARFYYEYRLLFQLEALKRKGMSNPELEKGIERLGEIIEEVIPDDGEPASLIHGDLWSGNFFIDERGEACIYDPAPYYGHREAEIGMMTLFGGFDAEVFRGYEEVYPLRPGWKKRNGIYQLYHLLNHYNLFGGGYYQQALDAMNQYLVGG